MAKLQAPQNYPKRSDCVILFTSPGESSSAARRLMEKTQKMGLVLVLPDGSCVTARRFLEKFQKPDFNSDIHVKYNPSPSYITIYAIKIKATNRNSPNLCFVVKFENSHTSKPKR